MNMRIFAIGDLHFDNKKEKPMDVFGENWIEHEQKIITNWQNSVSEDDLVLIPGDISWAIRLDGAKKDLEVIDALPGKKVLIRGNHDYWWATKNKLSKLNFSSIEFLVNDAYAYKKVVVCGVRGWDSYENSLDSYISKLIKSKDSGKNNNSLCCNYTIGEDIETVKQEEDKIVSYLANKKIYDRELRRFEMSLKLTQNYDLYKIAMLHYPPFNYEKKPNEFVALMKEYNINKCIYGHLHGKEGHKLVIEGNIEGIEFECVSSDYLNFGLKEIHVDK